ncbi:MAG: hypothetical protein JXP73_09305 [Deltaproteobacteria bacterium]|nr:hypothetical protein [Deltaproteobacteria bacterium]
MQLRGKQILWPLAAVALLALVGWDFAAATTFLSDDYIFRLYGRLEDNPLAAFVSDKHGGEYYRPLPMLLWWVLERLADGRAWAFALVSFLLHLLCAVLLVNLGLRLGLAKRTALLAGVLFFVAPAQRQAALWFSASTDLLAASAMLGAMVAFLGSGRRARALSVLLAALAFFCKETALVLPALLFAGGWFRVRQQGGSSPGKAVLLSLAPHLGALAVFLVARFVILGGLGGTDDPSAPWFGRGIQLASGLVHAVTAYAPLPEWAAWAAGVALLAATTAVAWRRHPLSRFAAIFAGLALLPLPAAGWVVGARYFYLPAAGLFLLAAIALGAASRLVVGAAVAFLLCLGILSGHHRAGEIRLYRQAVAAADAAVNDGLRRGHRLFLVRGGVKDLDLAIKLLANKREPRPEHVVLADVPASFVWLPTGLAERLRFLLAEPPLPPAGAYRFGGERIVGQARREEAPDLDEVLTRLPDLRIIRLVRQGDAYGWQDRTQEYHRAP